MVLTTDVGGSINPLVLSRIDGATFEERLSIDEAEPRRPWTPKGTNRSPSRGLGTLLLLPIFISLLPEAVHPLLHDQDATLHSGGPPDNRPPLDYMVGLTLSLPASRKCRRARHQMDRGLLARVPTGPCRESSLHKFICDPAGGLGPLRRRPSNNRGSWPSVTESLRGHPVKDSSRKCDLWSGKKTGDGPSGKTGRRPAARRSYRLPLARDENRGTGNPRPEGHQHRTRSGCGIRPNHPKPYLWLPRDRSSGEGYIHRVDPR